MANEEKKFTFAFSKVKKLGIKTTSVLVEKKPSKKSKYSSDSDKSSEDEIDLITEISGRKVKSTKPREEKKLPVIELKGSKRSAEDMDAIKALIEQATNKKILKKNESNFKIEIGEEKNEEEEIPPEDPDYEQVQLEDFGLACLRGMGWSEKEGIGKTNKQVVKMNDIELRPRGLGLGASFGNKKKNTDEVGQNEDDEKLVYAKGAYLEILSGKHANQFAQLVSFDDGLNRIMVKILDSNETFSVLQSATRLVNKSAIKHQSSKK